MAAILAETGLPPEALTVEVNERILVEEDGLIVDRLVDLHRLGVRMAIDDFGTGYASLAHLRQLPLDVIKIDPSFVAGLGQDDTLSLLTRTVVQVGRDLGPAGHRRGHRAAAPAQRAASRWAAATARASWWPGRWPRPGVEALIRTSEAERGQGRAGRAGAARLGM